MLEADADEVIVRDAPSSWTDAMCAALGTTSPDADVILLPEAIDNGVAVFSADLAHLVKRLRVGGVQASFLIGKNGKTFSSKYSADETTAVVGVLLNVLSSGIWDSIKVTFQMLRLQFAATRTMTSADKMTFRVGLIRGGDGTDIMWQEVSGPPDAVLTHAEALTKRFLAGGETSRPPN